MIMRLSSLFVLTIAVGSLSGQEVTRSGIHREDMDTRCEPCTDFWRYVNGTWLDKNPIPAPASWWGQQDVLVEATRERLRTLLESAAGDRDAESGSNWRKMGAFYASCMDTAAIDARGVSPLQADFDRIDAIQSLADLGLVLSTFQRMGRPFGGGNAVVPSTDAVVGAFQLTSGQDVKNPARVVAHIVDSSILSLPNRDYYLKDDETLRGVREAFGQHVTKM